MAACCYCSNPMRRTKTAQPILARIPWANL
ncbi:hypothetical protein RHECNPAF_890032 [Rhizobium etli CNPAF512]|nr:hypothetical protein RHECNPAF_890032 [Rhizobium etli CNPAF512]